MESSKPPKAERSGGGILLSILALVVGVGVGGMAGAFGVGPMIAQRITSERLQEGGAPVVSESSARSQRADREPGVVYELQNLIVNPAGSQGTRFLVVTLAVEMDGALTAAELERRDAEARDAVLRVLGGKTVAELSDVSAREALKNELLETLSDVVRVGEMRRIYLPQFVIQ